MPNGTEKAGKLIGLPSKSGGPPAPRRFRLTSARGVRKELAGLYGELRSGKVQPEVARAGGFILRTVLESLRLDEVERTLEQLEDQP